jgi:hypothetical protein
MKSSIGNEEQYYPQCYSAFPARSLGIGEIPVPLAHVWHCFKSEVQIEGGSGRASRARRATAGRRQTPHTLSLSGAPSNDAAMTGLTRPPHIYLITVCMNPISLPQPQSAHTSTPVCSHLNPSLLTPQPQSAHTSTPVCSQICISFIGIRLITDGSLVPLPAPLLSVVYPTSLNSRCLIRMTRGSSP